MTRPNTEELVARLQRARKNLNEARARIERSTPDIEQLTLKLQSRVVHDVTTKDDVLSFPRLSTTGVQDTRYPDVTIAPNLLERIFEDFRLVETATDEIAEIRRVAQERGIADAFDTSLPGDGK